MKDNPPAIFSGFNEDILPRLHSDASPHLRLPFDTIPDQRILVYRYLGDDFLSLIRKAIPMRTRRQILKASLRGLADLHDRDVVHLDIKPNNILVDYRHDGDDTIVEQVQIADLENAAYLPPGRCIKGMLAGNDDWRSPEAHFKGELNKAADMFSYGAVCVYAMLGRVIFGRDADMDYHEARGALPAMIRLQRQVSYFGDRTGVNGLMRHVGDEEINCVVLRMLWDDRTGDDIPYEPFSRWENAGNEVFQDLVARMMNLDPRKRITARQGLEHAWFEDCGD
ncbi:MAG: hypothetical protein M1817_002626 [Caeruleum heppii]|nr:MAG: hypothetical protein M1817_002626 [Caeruleum heppii]